MPEARFAATRDGTYSPQSVKRVDIPKGDGRTRPLGIPTVKDRIVQQAVRLVIEPIFEHGFSDASFGFRPGKPCAGKPPARFGGRGGESHPDPYPRRGHVARCENDACGHTVVAYNSCRDRHCPRCQGAASRKWLEAREAELLPVPYFHVVYTLPAELRDIAYQNKAVIYGLLMKASAETTLQIAADPRHLGARIGITAVLHTWGSASCRRRASGTMTHHPHVHMIVPGGGLSEDGTKWIAAKPDFLVHVNVLRRLFRGKVLGLLSEAHAEGRLQFFGKLAPLADKKTFKRFLAPLRRIDWVVYCKDPFGGPEQVLRYLSRYTHRVVLEARLRHDISNRRLIAADDGGVSFRWKDYRVEGPERWKTMTLCAHEFIRRFLIHVLPKGFHRIRHYGLFANGNRAEAIARARKLLAVTPPTPKPEPAKAAADEPRVLPTPCPCCGKRMHVIEVFARGSEPRHRPTPMRAVIRIDTS